MASESHTRDNTHNAIDILAAYEGDNRAREFRAQLNAGIDITDALYDALCEHDEHAAEMFLDGTSSTEWGHDEF